MPLAKSHKHSGKKPASFARKPAAKKTAGNAPAAGSNKSNGKRVKAAFSSLKTRQRTVESMKRAIWASLLKINDAIINAASNGNLASAKELFHFAGVYSLPNPDEENAAVAALPASPSAIPAQPAPANVHPIDEFFRRIGVEPSNAEPEPEVA